MNKIYRKFGWRRNIDSLCLLCALCVSVVSTCRNVLFTTETQSTEVSQRIESWRHVFSQTSLVIL